MAPPTDAQRIAVFAPNWLGDAVMATPALRALQNRFPAARIVVYGRPMLQPLLDGLPFVHETVPLNSRDWRSTIRTLRAHARAARPDIAVVFPHSFRAALHARISGAPFRLGYARNGRGAFLTQALPPPRENGRRAPIYMAREYLELLAPLGCEDDGLGLQLAAARTDLDQVRAKLPPDRPIAVLAPGAAFGPSKRWPPERYAAVADALAAAGVACVLWCGPGEEESRDAVLRHAKSRLIETHGGAPTIGLLKATIAAADLLVGNDSGPRHVAIAFRKPVVCIMGPTSPRYTDSPWERGELLRVEVDCGPCQKPYCATDHRCMTGIGVDRVASAALRLLNTPREALDPANT